MTPAASPRTKRPKLSRDEKARLTRENLLSAGAQVVGQEGYAAAAVARIADIAGVAHGTFYNYFTDRQALFDELLPYEGLRMRAYIEEAVHATEAGMAREAARFRAFLTYVAENTGFYRVLYEAEIFAPEAHDRHIETIVAGYRRSFQRAIASGHMEALAPTEMEALIYQLLGMRGYAAMQIVSEGDPARRAEIVDAAVAIYARLLRSGVFRQLSAD